MSTILNFQDLFCCRQKRRIKHMCVSCRWKCGLQLHSAFKSVLLMFGVLISMNQATTTPILITVDEGKSVTLPCSTEVSDTHQYQVRWFAPGDNQLPVLENNPLSGSWYDQNKGTIHGNSSIEIYSASIDDSGIYRCETKNLNDLNVVMTTEIELIVHDASPKIDPPERTSLLQNETLTLACRGGFYITWHYPESAESKVQIAITTHTTGSSIQSWKQTSVLTIDHVEYTDTGEYLCAHHHSNDDQHQVGGALYDTVYIYVTGPKDSTSLFIPTSQTTVTAYADDNSALVPCRVTNPAAKVSLITWPTPGRNLVISALATTQYDPQRGFVVTEQLQSFGDELHCMAQVGEKILDQQTFIFNYIGKPEMTIQTPSNKTLDSSTTDLIIAESDYILELVCTGQLPLIWYYPDTSSGKIAIESTAELNPVPNTGLLYRSVLRVTNITASETGEYACIMVRYIRQTLEEELHTTVYVYVTPTDVRYNLFLPVTVENRVVKVYPDQPFTVPCRISNPYYELDIGFGSFIDVDSPYDLKRNRNCTYDPKIGFTFGVHSEGKIIPSLQFFCWASSDLIYGKEFVLIYVGDNKGALFPKIYPSNEITIQGQQQVNITCEVSIEEGLYNHLTSDFFPKFDMRYPAQKHQEDIEKGNYEINYEDTFKDGHKLFCNILYIQNISLYDMGTYLCEVTNAAGKANASTEIIVLEQGYVKIQNTNFSTIGIAKNTNNFCRIQFEVDAFPDVKYEWLKDDQKLDMDALNIEQHVNGSSVYLCISRVEEVHAGNYTLIASNLYQREVVKSQLNVWVQANITIKTSPEPDRIPLPNLYRIGHKYMLNCSATGNPTPTVWWEWYGCTLSDGKQCSPPSNQDKWMKVSADQPGSSADAGVELTQSASNMILQVVMSAQLAGYYRCVAQSPKFDDIVTKPTGFLVTDIAEGFTIDEPYIEVYETERVELSCRASYYSFKFVKSWKRKDPVTKKSVFVLGNPRIEFKDEDMTPYYSIWRRLFITSANVSDSGIYKCIAKPMFDVLQTKEMELKVKAFVTPVILKGLQNQTKIDRSKGAYTLSCTVSGDPAPDIWWEENGEMKTGEVSPTSQPNVYKSMYPITILDEEHEGQYSCTASNLGGSAKSTSNIIILESPRVHALEGLVKAKIGMNATLSCNIWGLPEPTISWEHTTNDDKERVVPKIVYRNNGRMLFFKEVTEADAGAYRCIATNELGTKHDQIVLNINVPRQSSLETFLIPVIIVGSVLFILLIILIIIFARKLCTQSNKVPVQSPELHNYLEPKLSSVPSYLQDIIDMTPYDLRWEFPRERLQLGSVIGKGAFGMVIKAVAVGIGSSSRSTVVAVKTLREDAAENEYKALMAELKMLIHIGRHLNVVNFLGACTQQSPILVIVEYCRHGNLCHYLRSKRERFIKENGGENSYTAEPHTDSGPISPLSISRVTRSLEDLMSDERQQDYTRITDEEEDEDDDGVVLTINDLICYSFQISRGMEFLASKKCIHRDLAARNILVADHNVIKICDFGLSRNLYYDPDYIASSKSLLPIKWMAPESIFDKVFTSQSDVWSFGIVMWETFSLGGSPYPGFQVDERFYDKLKHGYRMTKPDYAAGEIYQIMLECWHREPKQRPTFGELVKILGERLEDRTKEEYMDLEAEHEKEYWEIPESIQRQENNSANADDDITINSPVDLDEPPDHPPLPVPRTIERRPKPVTNAIIETPPGEPLSPTIHGDSSNGSVSQPAVSNGLTPVTNLELSRLSFSSNDDLNLTVPMIPNPIGDTSRSSSPTEANALLDETLC